MRRNETRRDEIDLTGNRVEKSVITDTNHDGTFSAATDRDSVTQYTQDANDRMLSESTVVDGSATESTVYGYTGTQQTSKTVTDNTTSSVTSALNYTYDLQGRMSRAVTVAGNRTSDVSYLYGTDGIRISAREDVNENGSTSRRITSYLIDAQNHTGYQQVLQETVTDGTGNLIQKIVYTIGHDHISQTTFTPNGPTQGETAVFHMDGRGSTRILTHLAGAILNIAGLAQIFHYTAYGEAINFQMGNAATQYLYSGEQFDPRIGQQYLRARYYDSATGTFNRLDPFFGNTTDPQSFHKYRYTSGDPIQFADPTGLVEGLLSLMVSVGNNLNSRIGEAQAKIAVGGGSIFYLRGLERSQQLLNLLMQKGQNLVAWEQRIADASGDLIGRFRIDALIERVTNGTRVFTQIESKGVRWDFAFRNSPAWTTYLDQMTRQAAAFSRAAQTANGQPIQERVIVFSSKVPLGAESFRNEILRRISEHYDEVFWGLEEFELWLGR